MQNLPSGTVTFLFTDIEGSTQLWERYPEKARAALIRHDAIIEELVAKHDGFVVRPRGEGDSRFAVFSRASDAVVAAARMQQALQAEPWPLPTPLRIRAALHTGEADLREGDYYGGAVNRCARLRSAAHGGQTLVSAATQELVRDNLPDNIELHDLGEQHLKDLQRTEHVYQLLAPGLPASFPPLKTADARPNNLPTETTHFVGRKREIETIRNLLLQQDSQVRLVILTGPGGMGKTRLGLQVARVLLDTSDRFRDGLFFVALAPITEPALVASAIAQTLGVVTSGGQTVEDTLKDYLRDKELLLVVDNFEQVAEAAPLVAEFLSVSPGLKVLVTSREVLHLYGEAEFPVPPLDLPDPRHLPPLDQLTQYEAVRLFIERATLVKPDFVVTNDNAPAVAEICYRLDGLPLAIELAAARVNLLPPMAMLQRLQSRLRVLTGGARDLPARQQTLRGAIEWSHDLLSEEERKLFRRISVFVGGSTLEAAEAVCNAGGDIEDVLETISSLVDKSLLKQREEIGEHASGEARFWMLETIREYGVERLEQSSEAQEIRRLHAGFCLSLAEEAERNLYAPQPFRWLDRVEAEHDNIRAAIRWLLTEGDAEIALRLSGATVPFWFMRGYGREGRAWLEEALSLPGADKPTPARAKALVGVASVAWPQGHLELARVWSAESADIYRELGDRQGLANALTVLGVCNYLQGNATAAGPIFEEALALSEQLGGERFFALLLLAVGQMAMAQGDYAVAHGRLEEALAEYRLGGNRWDIAQTLNTLGDLARLEGDYFKAEQSYNESLELFREANAKGDIPATLHNLGHVALARGDIERARLLFEESLALHREVGNNMGIAESLSAFAGLQAVESQGSAALVEQGERGHSAKALRAARLFGASDALRGHAGAPAWPAERADYERNLAIARAQLDEQSWQKAWEEGREMNVIQAIEYALEKTQKP